MHRALQHAADRAVQLHLVEYIADHVAVMQAGRIGEAGVADAVLRYPRSPYTRSLLAAVSRIVPH